MWILVRESIRNGSRVRLESVLVGVLLGVGSGVRNVCTSELSVSEFFWQTHFLDTISSCFFGERLDVVVAFVADGHEEFFIVRSAGEYWDDVM